MAIFKKISQLILIAGIISFAYWPKVHQEGFFIPFRFETILSLAVFFAFIFFALRLFKLNLISLGDILRKFFQKERKIILAIAVFLLAILLATFLGFIQYGLTFNTGGLANLFKLFLGISLFWIIYIWLKQDSKFFRPLIFAFILPSILFIPFLFSPSVAEKMSFISSGYRFSGLTTGPGYWDIVALPAFSFLILFSLETFWKRRFLFGILSALATLGIAGLIYWSITRTYILAMFAMAILANVGWGFYRKRKLSQIYAWIFITVVSLVAMIFILPRSIQGWLFLRFNPAISYNIATEAVISGENGTIKSLQEISKNILNDPFRSKPTSAAVDDRLSLWKIYFPLAIKHPLGIGLNYEQKFSLEKVYPWGLRSLLNPLSILDLWMTGGILALISIGYLMVIIVLGLFKKSSSETEISQICRFGSGIAILGFGMTIIFFDLPIFYPGFWVLLAMALV